MSAALRLTLAAVLLSLFGLLGELIGAPASMAATPPVIEEALVLEASATGVTLHATIDPEGSETTYRFEYGTGEAYGASAPVPDGLVGSGSSPLPVTTHIQGLSASTVYHYRVVAIVPSRGEEVDGADGTFSTQPPGGSFSLPDGRQWELVSPPNKHGAAIEPISHVGTIQASEDGEAMTYMTDGTIEPEPAGYANAGQVFSQRGPQGWSSKDISTPYSSRAGVIAGSGFEYPLFSADLSLGLLNAEGPFTPLSAAETERSPNLRHDFSCESSPSTCYTPLVDREDVPAGVKWDKHFPDGQLSIGIAGATPDLSHVIISGDGLTETPGDEGGLYEWSAGHLQLVSVLPTAEGGAPSKDFPALGSAEGVSRHEMGVISNNGARIFWSDPPNSLYMRDTEKQETLRIGSGEVVFEAANSDGSRVFYTANIGGGEHGELDVCEVVAVAGKLSCDVTKLAPAVMSSLLGISKDGSWVYFVSNAALASDAITGECNGSYWSQPSGARCNLYALHYNGTAWESPKLVALLPGEDKEDWQNAATIRPTSVSANGRWLAFMSRSSLTGYDNRDAFTGKPDEEVYLYDSQAGKLSCVSCDPTGARPVGEAVSRTGRGGPDYGFFWSLGEGLAATIPGWTPTQDPYASLYQSRYLSEDGRLFFNSHDALVPQDVNGEWDVYEFEPEGVGGCESSSARFNAHTGGCVSLISAGTSPNQSGFMDASASGDDVFFLTTSPLTPEDFDSAYDIYDAHVCSAAAPCVTAPVSPPPCSTEASCRPAPTPEPAGFGAPASQTFSGVGNLAGSVASSTTTPKQRASTRSRSLARALRNCRRKRRAGRRKRCERTAKRKFAATQSRGVATPKRRGNR